MISAIQNLDIEENEIKLKNLKKVLNFLFFLMIVEVYVGMLRLPSSLLVFSVSLLIFICLKIEIITEKGRTYLYVYKQSKMKMTLIYLTISLILAETIYQVYFFYCPDLNSEFLIGKEYLDFNTLVKSLFLKFPMIYYFYLIGKENYDMKFIRSRGSFIRFLKLMKKINFFFFVFGYYVFLPFFFPISNPNIFLFLFLGFLIYILCLKPHIQNWEKVKDYLLVLFLLFLSGTVMMGYYLFYKTQKQYLSDFLVPFIFLLSFRFYSIIRIIIRNQPNEKVSEDFTEIVDRCIKNTLFTKYVLNIDSTEEEKKILEKLKRVFFLNDILILQFKIKTKLYLFLKRFYLSKRIIIFLIETFINIIIIIYFDFEYNLIGFIGLFFFTSSLVFKKTLMRFKMLLYFFFPIVILMNLQIYSFSNKTDNTLENFINSYSFIAIRTENLEKRNYYFLLSILIYILVKIHYDQEKQKEPAKLESIFKKWTSFISKDLLKEITKWAFNLMNYLFLYFFLEHLITEENIVNMIVLIIFLIMLFLNSNDLKTLFRLILIYHSFFLGLTFLYNMVDANLFSVSTETIIGINFGQCLRENFARFFISPNNCWQFRKTLILNFLFRINYYFLLRISFLNQKIKQHFLIKKFTSLYSFLTKFNIVFILLIYVYLSLIQNTQNIFLFYSVIVAVLLIVVTATIKILYAENLVFHNKAKILFKILLTLHLVMTIVIYFNRLFLLYLIDGMTEDEYVQGLQTPFFINNIRNNLFTKDLYFIHWIERRKLPISFESMKTLFLLISASLFKQSDKSVLKKFFQKIGKEILTGIVYFLYFMFFCINMYYLLYLSAGVALNFWKNFFIFFIIAVLNLMLRTFYQLGQKVLFKKVLTQEIEIFKSIFTKNLNKDYFKNSVINDNYWNEQYYFLKFIYKTRFFNQLKSDLLKILLRFTWAYFFFFGIYWSFKHFKEHIKGNKPIDHSILIVEILIFMIMFLKIYLMKLIDSFTDHNENIVKSTTDPTKLLINTNTIIMEIIKNKSCDKSTSKLDTCSEELNSYVEKNKEEFISYCSKKLIKPKKRKSQADDDLLNTLMEEHENEEIHGKEEDLHSIKEEDNFKKNANNKRNTAFEFFQFFLTNNTVQKYYNTLNSPLSKKIEYLPINKQRIMYAYFLYSSFDMLKEVILNFLLLTILNNINWFSIVVIIIVFGLRLIMQLKFLKLVYLISLSFLIRVLSFPPDTHMPGIFSIFPDAMKFVLNINNINLNYFKLEIFLIGSVTFLLIPTILLIKVVFLDFHQIPVEKNNNANFVSKMNFKNIKTLKIDYLAWTSKGSNFLTYFHDSLIIRGQFLVPTILMVGALYQKKLFKYFTFYMIYIVAYLYLIKNQSSKKKIFKVVQKKSYELFNLLIFGFFMYAALIILLQSTFYVSSNIIIVLFLFNFTFILNRSDFYRFDKERVKKLYTLNKELRIFLKNLSNNEKFILKKIISQIKYNKIEKFQDKTKDQFFSLNNLLTSNLFFFNKVFLQKFRQKVFYNIYFYFYFTLFQNSQKFYYENTFHLLLLIKSKYQNIINLEFDTIDLLTMRYSSGFESIKKINELRKKIHMKEHFLVQEMNKKLKKINETHITKESDFKEFEMEHFKDEVDPGKFIEKVKLIFQNHLDKESQNEENFSNKGYKSTIDGQHLVIIKNYKYNYMINEKGAPYVSITTLCKLIFSLFIQKLDRILAIAIICFMLFTYGIILFFLLFYFIFHILNEKGTEFKVRKMIKFSIMLLGVIGLKHLLRIFFNNYFNLNQIDIEYFSLFVFGNFKDYYSDLIILFLVYCLIHVYLSKWCKKYFPEKEFFGEATYRIILNNSLMHIGSKYHFKEILLLNYYKNFFHENDLADKKQDFLDSLKFYLKENLDIRSKILKYTPPVFLSLKDFHSITNYQKYQDFYWRNFSYQNIGYGADNISLKIIINIFFVGYSFFYFKFYKKKLMLQNIEEIGKEDSVEGVLLFNITLAFILILFEIIFYNYQTMTWSQHIKVKKNFQLEHILTKTEESQVKPDNNQNYKSRFRIVAKGVFNMLKFYKKFLRKDYIENDYLKNTYLKKYKMNQILFSIGCILFLMYMPSYDEELFVHTVQHLIRSGIDFHLRTLFFILTIYLVINVLDSNVDKTDDYDSILNNDFDSKWNMIMFKINLNIPFITEIKTVLIYISSKTSLDIFKWYRVEDIKRILLNSKYINAGFKKNMIGMVEPSYVKIPMGYGFFLVFFLILIAPLLFFSNLNFLVSIPKIKSANFQIKIQMNNPYKQNFSMMIADINYFDVIPIGAVSENDSLNEKEINNLIELKSQVLSSTVYDYNLNIFPDFKEQDVLIIYNLILKTDQKEFIISDILNDSTVEEKRITDFLSFDCRDIENIKNQNNIFEKFYIGRMNLAFETTKNGEIRPLNLGIDPQKFYIKPQCFKDKKYHSLSLFNTKHLNLYFSIKELGGDYYLKNLKQTDNTVI